MVARTASSFPLLRARPLLDLTLCPSDHPRGLPFLSAASGLVCAHGCAYVIADDEHHLAVFRDLRSPGTLHRVHAGDLPHKTKARKRRKPDLETLLWLPRPHGAAAALVALGSGSRENRCTGLVISLDRRGQPLPQVQAFDLAPLYRPLAAQLGGLNVEGAMSIGDDIVLLNRGGRDGLPNAAVRLPATALHALIGGTRSVARWSIQSFDLGHLDGVALGFTDGAARADGSWFFSAAAERSADSVADGPCAGSVVGRVSARGELTAVRRLDSRDKIEGIALQPDGPAICMVTDADDPQQSARLLRAAWPIARD